MPEEMSDGVVAFCLTDLNGRVLDSHLPDRTFYAASTMKVAVLIDVFRRHDAGVTALAAPVTVATTFRSGLDGSPFTIEPDDVDAELAARAGEAVSVLYLAERMITVSSNEATNLLLQLSGFEGVAAVVSELAGGSMVVQRMLDDGPARAAGLENLVTAGDLSRLMGTIANGSAAGPRSCDRMVEILERQTYREEIPAGLPPGVRVANKTGWVKGVLHDTALVWPPDANPYCLSVCTEGFADQEVARGEIRRRSALAWERRLRPAETESPG
ncbi:MAG TPA: serine hydrolase [Candidatus Dormibacteraeota bacterium]|nr:serine hydrolase [Candidatus Dormibacteraeota bacterium]